MRTWILGSTVLLAAAACGTPSHRAPEYHPSDEPAPIVTPTPAPTTGDEAATPARRPPQAVQRPFIYRVDRAERPSYLFGTIHVGVSLDAALPAQYLDVIDQSRVVLVEIDPTAMRPEELTQAARLRRGSLADAFRASTWHSLTDELQRTFPIDQLRHVRPWFAMVVLTQKRAADVFGGGRLPEAMDVTLVRYAQDRGLALRPLETPAQQMAALGAIPDDQMVRVVSEMVEHPDRFRDELQGLVDAYRLGIEVQIEDKIFDPEQRRLAPEMHEHLFTRRNAAWLPVLKRELDEGGAFVAVGLGHWLGDQGLLATLRAEGYTITRVD